MTFQAGSLCFQLWNFVRRSVLPLILISILSQKIHWSGNKKEHRAPPLLSTAQSGATRGTSSSKSLSPTYQPAWVSGRRAVWYTSFCNSYFKWQGKMTDHRGWKIQTRKKCRRQIRGREGGRNRMQKGDESGKGKLQRRRYSPCPIVYPCREEWWPVWGTSGDLLH